MVDVEAKGRPLEVRGLMASLEKGRAEARRTVDTTNALRQALWDSAAISGMDTGGKRTPDGTETVVLIQRVLDGVTDARVLRAEGAEEHHAELAEARGQLERLREEPNRLYILLGRFDTRDGSPLAHLVRSAREGYERAAMGEDDAWAEFDARDAFLAESGGPDV